MSKSKDEKMCIALSFNSFLLAIISLGWFIDRTFLQIMTKNI